MYMILRRLWGFREKRNQGLHSSTCPYLGDPKRWSESVYVMAIVG
jgi:hypothetical protein